MMWFTVSFACATLMPAVVLVQDRQSTPPEAVQTGTTAFPRDIEFYSDQPEHVGAIPVGQMAGRSVRFANRGRETIELRVVAASCGCVNVRFGSSRVEPGGVTDIEISTLAVEAPQDQLHYAEIEAVVRNELGLVQSRTSRRLAFAYTPHIELAVSPKIVTMNTVAGLPFEATLVLRRMDGDPVQLDDVSLPGPWVRVKQFKHVPETGSTHLMLEGPQAYAGWLRLRATGQATSQAILVNLRAEPQLRSTPSGVIISNEDGAARRYVIELVRTQVSLAVEPHTATIEPPLDGARCGDIKRVPGADAWSVELEIAHGAIFEREPAFGYRHLSVLDQFGKELTRVPIVWLRTPARSSDP